MSFRSFRPGTDAFRPSFNNANMMSSQVPYNAFNNFNSGPQSRFRHNFENTRETITSNTEFSDTSANSVGASNIPHYDVRKSNVELRPTNYNFNNNFVARQPLGNSSVSHPKMNNNGQAFHRFPPPGPPVRFLAPGRFSGPNVNQQSPLPVIRNRPVLQNSNHEMPAFNQQQHNISSQNFNYCGQNVNFQNNLPVTTSNYLGSISNMHQTNISFGEVSNSLPKISEHVSNVCVNINNVNVVSTSVSTPHLLPAACTNSMAISGNNSNNLILHPVIPVSMQVPPPVIPRGIPVHIPPPPISTVEISGYVPFPIPTQTLAYEKELKLTEFLAKFSSVRKEKKILKVAIPEFRSALATAFSISKELLKRKQKLHDLLHSDRESWNSEMIQISSLKNKLSEICLFVSDPLNLNRVMKKLHLIKKKREQKKKTKLNKKSAKMKAELLRKERNQEIDKWLDDIKEKNLKLKREAEMKKEADIILLEVRKKIHEANRTIEKIKVFEKLRNVRKENSVKKGLHITSEHDENFERKVVILKKMMSRQLADYEAEERALKVMLETEQEGQLEEEIQWKLKKAKALQQKKQKHIVESLFGNSEDPLPADPLYLFHKFHTSAYSSIDNLIQIRHQWDAHLSEDGEAVPQQWVVPSTASDSSWEQCLITSVGGLKS